MRRAILHKSYLPLAIFPSTTAAITQAWNFWLWMRLQITTKTCTRSYRLLRSMGGPCRVCKTHAEVCICSMWTNHLKEHLGVGGMVPHLKVCILAAVQTSYLGPQICRGFQSVAEPSRRPVFQWCQLWGTRRMASYPPHAVLEMPALSPTMSQVTPSSEQDGSASLYLSSISL